jgi:hypothetical protein
VARELMMGINEAAFQYRWWDDASPGDEEEDRLPLFSTDHDDTALVVSTIATGSAPEGILVKFGDTQARFVGAFMPRSVSRGLVISIATMGAAGDWWGEDFKPKPAVMVDDMVVTRAANHLIQRYGKRAEMEAAMRANQAQEESDQFNYELWQRVAMAVANLQRSKPISPNAIH